MLVSAFFPRILEGLRDAAFEGHEEEEHEEEAVKARTFLSSICQKKELFPRCLRADTHMKLSRVQSIHQKQFYTEKNIIFEILLVLLYFWSGKESLGFKTLLHLQSSSCDGYPLTRARKCFLAGLYWVNIVFAHNRKIFFI